MWSSRWSVHTAWHDNLSYLLTSHYVSVRSMSQSITDWIDTVITDTEWATVGHTAPTA